MVETIQKKTSAIAVLSLVFGCLFLIPLLGIIFSITAVILGIIALSSISKNENNLKGRGLAIGGLILGVIGVILIPIFLLLAAIAIPNLLKARIAANDASAKAYVTMASSAIESFASANNGKYPSMEADLTSPNPPYLTDGINNKLNNGYKFSLELKSGSYKISATPENCGTTGTKVFTVMPKGDIQETECK